ncbi:MAG: helix-turn-helix transcriptional regulator [Clostridia bacterium]|nr:helix-turn-helix transcriptional regulator [Clostridia bacterium]
MAIDAQLKKGLLDGCVLQLISKREMFSQEIVLEMRKCGFSDFSEGTLYPMLMRLEKEGCFTIVKKTSLNSPPRKFYALSQTGEIRLKQFVSAWREMELNIRNIFAEEGEDETR